ncbi:cupin domain-containing protein [Planosporangium thailandense]|uniref:cupin domain-containing protein n=1 Tax=Planosporangium thailandense TaxID=765197 RepID=UPI00197B9436
MEQAHSEVQINEAGVRVTRWRFEVGEHTGTHRHEVPYVVVPVVSGRVGVRVGDDVNYQDLVAGRSYLRPAGAEHDVYNAGIAPFTFVEIELVADHTA